MIRAALGRVLDAGGALAALCVFTIFIVMLGGTVMRALGLPTGGADDLVSWLTAAAAFYGLAHTFRHGDFVRVGLLLERFAAGPRRIMELIALSIATVFTAYLAWSVVSYVVDSWRFGDMSNGLLVMPIWIPQSSVAGGAVLLFLAVADQLVHVLRGGRPDYVVAVERRHAAGDFSEDV